MLGSISSVFKNHSKIFKRSDKSTKQLFWKNHQLRRNDFGEGICIFGIIMQYLKKKLQANLKKHSKFMKGQSNSFLIKNSLSVSFGYFMLNFISDVMI